MMDAIIAKLESKGFNRWAKGRFDRLYINARDLGLSCTYHRTGSEDTSMFGGVSISNSEARRMKSTKCYIDVATGEVVCDNDMMREAAEAILESCEEPEVAEDAEAEAEATESDMESLEVIDSNDTETLYRLNNEIYNDWRILVIEEQPGVETTYLLNDEEGYKPDTLAECAEYDWYRAEDADIAIC